MVAISFGAACANDWGVVSQFFYIRLRHPSGSHIIHLIVLQQLPELTRIYVNLKLALPILSRIGFSEV